jgi:DNA processing protein
MMAESELIHSLKPDNFPERLSEIPDPPKQLHIKGALPKWEEYKFLTVVGSRKWSNYGKQAVNHLVGGLAGHKVGIVSGMAIGIDSFAHETALAAGLPTIAVLPSGLDWSVLYPRTNHHLARRILSAGGALISENEADHKPELWDFPKRNRIMVGISHAVLVIEGEEKSGTMITARLASEYNRELLALPGSIFASGSAGPHMLMRLGAAPARNSSDLLVSLGLADSISAKAFAPIPNDLSANEKRIFELLREPLPRDELMRALGLRASSANVILTALEIKGLIVEELGKVRKNF